MKVRRRRFLQALATTPAAALAQRREAVPGNPAAPAPPAQPPAKLTNTGPDAAAETVPHFFSSEQLATLRRLGTLFMPPLQGMPGALEAGAPEFLDFLVGVSPVAHKELYLNGLDALAARARIHFGKTFAELDAAQAETVIRPLLEIVAWEKDWPSDPLKHFVARVHDDLRTATVNSREWAAASVDQAGGRRARGGGVGLYVVPIDPVYRG